MVLRLSAFLVLGTHAVWAAKADAIDLSRVIANDQSSAVRIVLFLSAMTLLPAVIAALTPFLRITIVLHFLRQALGTQSAPSNQVLLGLSLFLTTIVMQPVALEIYEKSLRPYEEGRLTSVEAWRQGSGPLRDFLVKYCREKDLQLMLEITKTTPIPPRKDLDLRIVAPAYVLSELRTSFQIGAVLFLPFLMIDLIVAGVTLSIGMVQLPPVMVSAPFKILLFVLVDGWNLVVGSLVKSFSQSAGG